MNRNVLVMDEKDNVGVLLEEARKKDTCKAKGQTIEILDDIEFAHKVALTDILAEEPVIKYGQAIGHAEKNIRKGQWVHSHNMGCRRGK